MHWQERGEKCWCIRLATSYMKVKSTWTCHFKRKLKACYVLHRQQHKIRAELIRNNTASKPSKNCRFSRLKLPTQNGLQPVYASCCSTRSVHFDTNTGSGGSVGKQEEAFGCHRYFSATFKERVRAWGLAFCYYDCFPNQLQSCHNKNYNIKHNCRLSSVIV